MVLQRTISKAVNRAGQGACPLMYYSPVCRQCGLFLSAHRDQTRWILSLSEMQNGVGKTVSTSVNKADVLFTCVSAVRSLSFGTSGPNPLDSVVV
jgi:hypothetical protein